MKMDNHSRVEYFDKSFHGVKKKSMEFIQIG